MTWIFVPAIVFAGFLFSGCAKENIRNGDLCEYDTSEKEINIICGEADDVSVWSTVKSPLQVDDNAISDLNIYLVDDFGVVCESWYMTNYRYARAKVDPNREYAIYAIANLGTKYVFRTIDEITEYSYAIDNINNLVNSKGAIVMSGFIDYDYYKTSLDVFVDLIRCVSQIIVKCDYSGLNSDVQVDVKRVQLKNAPTSMNLFSTNATSSFTVTDGEERNGNDLNGIDESGVSFYLFENSQGIVAPLATDNKSKIIRMSSLSKSICSYIELEYDYLSPRKEGTIVYRFYIGTGYSDCDILRNTKYLCTVYFNGDASANENSESVDISGMRDRVTDIVITPSSYRFYASGETTTLSAVVSPETAYNQNILWNSSNTNVASVDNGGNVTAIGLGESVISAVSTDGTNIFGLCTVSVVETDLAFKTKADFAGIDGKCFIPWDRIIPSDAIPTVTVDDPSFCEIIDVTSLGITLFKKIGPQCVVTAKLGNSVATITVYAQISN